MEKHKLFAFVGPSQAGKTTIIRELLKVMPDELEEALSLTTRPRRGAEDDGTYRFISADKLLEKQAAGKLIQIIEYAGYSYANDRDEMDRLLKRSHGLIALTEQGVRNFLDAKYEVVVIRVIPVDYQATSDEARVRADEARAKLSITVHIEVLNSFSPGGLESAVEELTRLIKRAIAKPPPAPAPPPQT